MILKDGKRSNVLYIHHICERSLTNGPGARAVIWTQGCSIGCSGCFNPSTHLFDSQGVHYQTERLGLYLAQLNVAGLTITGGEPLDQPIALLKLLCAFKARNNGTILLFTGYNLEEILASEEKRKVLLACDAALAGRFLKDKKHWEAKRLLLMTGRIKPEQIAAAKAIELAINGDTVTITGYPNLPKGLFYR